MKYTSLNENLKFSRIIAGCMRTLDAGMDGNKLRNFVHNCMDMGIDTFDHAPVYGAGGCEKIFGDEEMGFTTLFVKAEPSYSCITTTDGDTAGNMFLISKDLKTVLCGVKIEEEEFLLVVPAEDKATADGMIDNAAKQSQVFSWWLLEVYKDIIKDTVK